MRAAATWKHSADQWGDGLMGTLHGTLPARPREHGVFRNIAHPRPHNNTNAMPFGPSAILAEPHEAPNANEGVSGGSATTDVTP